MPRPYSVDLRQRVLAACDGGEGTRAEIAGRFRVSESALYAWLEQRRCEGRTAPKPHAGGYASRVDVDVLAELVREKPDRTLAELAALYHEKTGERVDPSWVAKLLKRRRIVRKK